MPTVQGKLEIKSDGQLTFTSDKVEVKGVYAEPLDRDLEIASRASFDREGPYTFTADLGTFGVNFRLSGPVGEGKIVGERVPLPLTVIRGSVMVTFKEDGVNKRDQRI